jgi:hypothetical protein
VMMHRNAADHYHVTLTRESRAEQRHRPQRAPAAYPLGVADCEGSSPPQPKKHRRELSPGGADLCYRGQRFG